MLQKIRKEDSELGSIDFDKIIPQPDGLYLGDLGIEEMRKYKGNNWYDWRIKHWNTKWNAYGFKPPEFGGDTGCITFLTANCSPFPVLFRVSELFPDVELELRYADEDLGYNVGTITLYAGEMIDDDSPREGSAEAQELAADILGIDLDFDVRSGSGYVVSLLGNYYEYCDSAHISQAFQCDVSSGCPVVLCYDEDHGKVWLEKSPVSGEDAEEQADSQDLIRTWGVHSCRSMEEYNQYLRYFGEDPGITEQDIEDGGITLC